jgi:hypothetical protein
MTSISEMCVPAFLEAYDFGAFTKIVDVGGGHGAVLRAILREYTDLSGTIAEMPSVVEGAKKAIADTAQYPCRHSGPRCADPG